MEDELLQSNIECTKEDIILCSKRLCLLLKTFGVVTNENDKNTVCDFIA